jgi:hypothetical protein
MQKNTQNKFPWGTNRFIYKFVFFSVMVYQALVDKFSGFASSENVKFQPDNGAIAFSNVS